MKLPDHVNIFDTRYRIIYVDKPSEVDVFQRESLWGQCDFWTRTIRVYVGSDRDEQDIWHTIWHEVIHAIVATLHIKDVDDDNNTVDLLAGGINDVLIRNNWSRE